MKKGPSGHSIAEAIASSSLCLSYSVPLFATKLLNIYFILNDSTSLQKAISVESKGTYSALSARQRLPSHKLPLQGLEIIGWSSSCLPCSPVRPVMVHLQELKVKILSRATSSSSKDQDTENSPGFEGSMRGHPGRALSHRCPSWLKHSCWQRCRISQAICSPAKLPRLLETFP